MALSRKSKASSELSFHIRLTRSIRFSNRGFLLPRHVQGRCQTGLCQSPWRRWRDRQSSTGISYNKRFDELAIRMLSGSYTAIIRYKAPRHLSALHQVLEDLSISK